MRKLAFFFKIAVKYKMELRTTNLSLRFFDNWDAACIIFPANPFLSESMGGHKGIRSSRFPLCSLNLLHLSLPTKVLGILFK